MKRNINFHFIYLLSKFCWVDNAGTIKPHANNLSKLFRFINLLIIDGNQMKKGIFIIGKV